MSHDTLDADTCGYGQVVASVERVQYCFLVFATKYSRSEVTPPLADVVNQPIAFLAMSFDAKLQVGDWEVVGHMEVPPDLPMPAFKVRVGADDMTVDYAGKIRRKATSDESRRLPFHSAFAPIRLESALRALHGLTPWREDFDELRPNWENSIARVLNES
jgi:hypothetical protein